MSLCSRFYLPRLLPRLQFDAARPQNLVRDLLQLEQLRNLFRKGQHPLRFMQGALAVEKTGEQFVGRSCGYLVHLQKVTWNRIITSARSSRSIVADSRKAAARSFLFSVRAEGRR